MGSEALKDVVKARSRKSASDKWETLERHREIIKRELGPQKSKGSLKDLEKKNLKSIDKLRGKSGAQSSDKEDLSGKYKVIGKMKDGKQVPLDSSDKNPIPEGRVTIKKYRNMKEAGDALDKDSRKKLGGQYYEKEAARWKRKP